ncbi:MAG: MBL fold metallo-hydrolase [Bacteroidales bacterium]
MVCNVTYIYHSGFAIEMGDGITLLFDYYKDTTGALDAILSRTQRLYVFASHAHRDHFVPEIFDFKGEISTTYILSDDILGEDVAIPDNSVTVAPNMNLMVDNLKVTTYDSTDLGVAFKVEIDGVVVFHAGDLNNWHWRSESTEAEIAEAEIAFRKILDRVMETTADGVDIIFFPVDARMREGYADGAKEILEKVSIKHFFPMHFGRYTAKAFDFDLYGVAEAAVYHSFKDGEMIKINI